MEIHALKGSLYFVDVQGGTSKSQDAQDTYLVMATSSKNAITIAMGYATGQDGFTSIESASLQSNARTVILEKTSLEQLMKDLKQSEVLPSASGAGPIPTVPSDESL